MKFNLIRALASGSLQYVKHRHSAKVVFIDNFGEKPHPENASQNMASGLAER
jgi:hypothetical protein